MWNIPLPKDHCVHSMETIPLTNGQVLVIAMLSRWTQRAGVRMSHT